jgi:hypothetical protein
MTLSDDARTPTVWPHMPNRTSATDKTGRLNSLKTNLSPQSSVLSPLLRQSFHHPAVELCCMAAREGDILGQIVWKEFKHISVPIWVEQGAVLEFCIVKAGTLSVSILGY